MKLKTAVIEGFKSFVAQASVEFGDAGLVFVTGKNEVEPALGANGAGKSTVFEAICWCLYGKTSRGLKAGNIKSWAGCRRTSVSVSLEAQCRAFSVTREQSPNRLTVEEPGQPPREVDQAALDSMLGLSFQAFLNLIYFAQFSPGFLDLSASEQMALFSEVLELDLWEQATQQAATAAKKAEDLLASVTFAYGKAQGVLISRRAFAEAEGYRVASLIRDQYYQGLSLNRDLKYAWAKVREAEAAVAKEDKAQKKLRVELKGQLVDLEEEVSAADQQVAEWQVELTLLRKERKPQTQCPNCGASLDSAQIKAATKAYQVAQKRIEELQGLLEKAQEWKRDWLAEIKDLRRCLEEDFKDLESSKELANYKQLVAQLVSEHKAWLHKPLPEVDPQALQELKEQEEEVAAYKAKVAALNREVESLRYWQKEFKELRLYLIEESLTQLEVESNSALHELGLEEWRVEFDVEREKKTGGIKTGFSVLIYSPHTEQAVPWEAWSGGESQRLRLAVTMGFASLIASRAGAEPNVEFWDEPSTWLSTSGITDLMQTLKSRAEASGRQIWIADHRTLEYGGFSRTITVTKTETGSTIN